MTRILLFIKKEFKEALPALVFFFVMFHLVAITKAVLLNEHVFTARAGAVATAFALIVTKVILIADKLPLNRLFNNRPAIYTIVVKTIVFSLITLFFRFLEEAIPLVFKYGGISSAADHFVEDISWPHFLIIQLWLISSLALFCTAVELVGAFGAAKVKEALLGPRNDLRPKQWFNGQS